MHACMHACKQSSSTRWAHSTMQKPSTTHEAPAGAQLRCIAMCHAASQCSSGAFLRQRMHTLARAGRVARPAKNQHQHRSAQPLTAVACACLYFASICFWEAITYAGIGVWGPSALCMQCRASKRVPRQGTAMHEHVAGSRTGAHLRGRLPHLNEVLLHLGDHLVQDLLRVLGRAHCERSTRVRQGTAPRALLIAGMPSNSPA